MASLRSDIVQRHLQTLFTEGAVGTLTDAELLEPFHHQVTATRRKPPSRP